MHGPKVTKAKSKEDDAHQDKAPSDDEEEPEQTNVTGEVDKQKPKNTHQNGVCQYRQPGLQLACGG